MSDVDTAAAAPAVDLRLTEAFIVIVVVGAGLSVAARTSGPALIAAAAVVQVLLAFAWVFGTVMPGRWGGVLIGVLAAAGADTAVALRPHERLGVLVTVLGLTIPVIFVHQLFRGAARVQVVASMGAVALLAIAEVSLAALVQTLHEFGPGSAGGVVASTVVAALAAALAVGYVADQVIATPRFDADVPRGLVALVLSAAAGAAAGYLLMHGQHHFGPSRAAFVGAALGVLAGLLSVACSFVVHTTPEPQSRWAALGRPVITALLPLALLAPAAFLLCLAIRT